MINFLIGAPGSGKSYEAVRFHLIPALQSGRRVITNLPIDEAYLYAVMPEARGLLVIVKPTPDNPVPFSTVADYAGDSWRHPESGVGPLFIIDECHKPLPRGRTQTAVDEWFAESRHSVSDALLITQGYRKVSAPIVDLSQLHFRVRKNIALGSETTYVRKVQDGPRGEVVNESVRTYEPAFFKFYKSHTRSDSAASEASASGVRPIWFHWSFIGAALFLVLAVVLFFTGDFSLFNPKPPVANVPVIKTLPSIPARTPSPAPDPEPAATVIDAAAPAPLPEHPLKAYSLHISGWINASGRTLYSLDAAQNGQRVFSLTTEDLLKAGYSFHEVSPCILEVKYRETLLVLTCGVPQASMQIARG